MSDTRSVQRCRPAPGIEHQPSHINLPVSPVIALFIFYVHTVAAVWIFTKRWQDGDWKEGMLAVGFLALIFSVGWSMSTFILKLFVDEKGFAVWLDRDALSLLLLAVMEGLFFYIQMKRKKKASVV